MTKNATNMVKICIDKIGEKMYTHNVGKSFGDFYSARACVRYIANEENYTCSKK